MGVRLPLRAHALLQSVTTQSSLQHRTTAPVRQRLAAFSNVVAVRQQASSDGLHQSPTDPGSFGNDGVRTATEEDSSADDSPSSLPVTDHVDTSPLEDTSDFDPGQPLHKPKAAKLVDLRARYQAAMRAAREADLTSTEPDAQAALQPLYNGRPAEHSAPFRIGRKKVYLPDFRIALVRDRLPAHYATFVVPLHLNKLDLRDYLFHAYSIRSVSITSRTYPGRVTDQGDPAAGERPRIGQLYRLPATKKMTVLMDRPFVWPAVPDDRALEEEWQRDIFAAARKEGEQSRERRRKRDTYVDRDDREEMRRQAKRLIEGKEAWRPPSQEDGNWAVRVVETEQGEARV